jgi:hypothetical protein
MNDTVARWIKRLPLRWGLGGLVLAVVWSIISTVAQGSFVNPAGGQVAAMGRLFVAVILPLWWLGILWGWSERNNLERAAAKGVDQWNVSIRRIVSRQTLKAMICGMTFGIFTYCLLPGFRLHADFHLVLSLTISAIPVGVIVGVLFRRNLIKRAALRVA